MRTLPLLFAFALAACSGSDGTDIGQRDIVGTYVGAGSGPQPLEMHISADGRFTGDLPIGGAQVRKTGTWRLGAANGAQHCREIEFLEGSSVIGKSCFAVGADQVTGMDCTAGSDGAPVCARRRQLHIEVPLKPADDNAAS